MFLRRTEKVLRNGKKGGKIMSMWLWDKNKKLCIPTLDIKQKIEKIV